MADEQHEWLDADTAEKLLRGASVESVDDHSRTGLPRLEATLRAVRTPAPARGELPGEAAAMAAFREASGSGRRAGAAHPATAAGTGVALSTVRIGAPPEASPRRRRWTRPVRFGLAVSLAGCALGGVAVAGGTGMLPVPFGGHGAPVPAASVSAAASPEEMGGEAPEAERSVPPPSAIPEAPRTPPPSEEPDGAEEEKPADGVPPSVTGGVGSPPSPQDGNRDRETGDDGAQGGTDGREVPEGSAGGVFAKSVRACREYRADALSKDQERRLLELADGEDNLDRFCDRVLAADDRNGGGGGKAGGGQDDGGDAGGSLPPVTFHTRDAPGDGTGTRPTASPESPSTLPVRR
ncbi:hypothetical protein OG206_12725 [Streptomyces sp. NBC_01341]|uniref:hypothetical protein n=1 Tax=Streptomyces sp. NBC_01341 TaxID=2903831 RepID=UPI002E0EE3E8|nr:hypothetical protein OG206_12725 [Streptomyces sp. NBC_01341]